MNENLNRFRSSKSYSLKEMAIEIGVSKSYYEKIEHGKRNPSYNFIRKFVTRFPDADLDKIFYEVHKS